MILNALKEKKHFFQNSIKLKFGMGLKNLEAKQFQEQNAHGCGLTHASIYIIKGELRKAIDANYSVFFWWGLIIIFIIDRYIHKLNNKIMPVVFSITIIVTMVRYIMKYVFFYVVA